MTMRSIQAAPILERSPHDLTEWRLNMSWKNWTGLTALAALMLAALPANAGVRVGVGLNFPIFVGGGYYRPYYPCPVYAPVYFAPPPAPVYVMPQPVYVQPAPAVYQAPAQAMQPAPAYYQAAPQTAPPPLAPPAPSGQ
jgi:hypothetical protein